MGDGNAARQWGLYLRQLTARKGWSVARLARESDIHRGTIFDWIKGGTGESVTTGYVVAVARAVGDDPLISFRAAAGLTTEEPEDREISLVLEADLADKIKDDILASIVARRERDRERRMEDTIQMIRIAGGKVA